MVLQLFVNQFMQLENILISICNFQLWILGPHLLTYNGQMLKFICIEIKA